MSETMQSSTRCKKSLQIMCVAVFAYLLVILSGCHSIPQSAFAPAANYTEYLMGEDTTWFTHYPAYAGVGLGIPVAILMLPIVLPLADDSGAKTDPERYEAEVGWFGAMLTADIIGTPFLVLEKVFYGFPRMLLCKEAKPENKNPENTANDDTKKEKNDYSESAGLAE